MKERSSMPILRPKYKKHNVYTRQASGFWKNDGRQRTDEVFLPQGRMVKKHSSPTDGLYFTMVQYGYEF
jgi:hypothetical protein